ncbi:MAG: prepilin-type N-terminal cleavage/methylation domain-containing protein [Sedimentisphaerales bacterium]|nr:prepilin-type N-terminal cleavage/methylation domain-containing protein [Sedimentisphaerales bacterium]
MRSNGHIERPGFTLIEVMVALAGFLVVIIGGLSFQYYCAVDTREADVRAVANRLALLMLEGWRGSAGSDDFQPEFEFGDLVAIETTTVGLPGIGFELPSRYKIVANRANYFVTLSYNDDVTGPGDSILRTLSVSVAWDKNYKAEELSEYLRSVALTTLVEN